MFNDNVLAALLLAAQERHSRLVDERQAGDMSDEHKQKIYEASWAIDAIDSLVKGDSIAIIWSTDDVISLGEDNEGNTTTQISEQEARDALASVKQNHNAEYGVNWDTLWEALLSVKEGATDASEET